MSGMFEPEMVTRPKAEVDMENAAQHAWQKKAKAAVTALIAAIGADALNPHAEILDNAAERMRVMGYYDPDEVFASLIR